MRPVTPNTLLIFVSLAILASGCHLVVPEVSEQPIIHNPFPQLSRVAVTPFFNQSSEATVDGAAVANAYYSELQAVPGYEVVPVGVVISAMRELGLTNLDDPNKVRALGQMLDVDAVVVGSVTDYSPYYPPRCGMRVSWYATNPGYHEIPAGYGLPWGTPLEEYIPPEVVFDAEMALARAQMKTQEPLVHARAAMDEPAMIEPNAPREPRAFPLDKGDMLPPDPFDPKLDTPAESLPAPGDDAKADAIDASDAAVTQANHSEPVTDGSTHANALGGPNGMFPPDWPDASGFTPSGPLPTRPIAEPNLGPVMTHTQVYHGADAEFTAALADYVGFRDDARLGSWQSYLTRSDDFIRFCCHRHITEMLMSRGGGGETRVVSRWPKGR